MCISLSVISVQMCSSNCFDKTCLWLVFSATFCWLIESCEHTTVYQCQHRHYQIPTSIRYGMILYLLLSNITHFLPHNSLFVFCFSTLVGSVFLFSLSLFVCLLPRVYPFDCFACLPVQDGLLATQKEKSAKKYLKTRSTNGLIMARPHWYPPEEQSVQNPKTNCCMQMYWELSATLHLPLNSLFVKLFN